MKLKLIRTALKPNYTIGHLYADGVYVCDTIEDKNRDLNFNGKFDNGEQKVMHQTCIPFGTYKVTIDVVSPKFNQKEYYHKFCGGRVPRLLNVPSFDGILIHRGTDQNSSSGCIIVGYNKVVGKVVDSQQAFEKLYKILQSAKAKNDPVTIEIVKR